MEINAASAAFAAAGSLNATAGSSAVPVDFNSDLADCAEEVGFAKDNSRKQKLADRKSKSTVGELRLQKRIQRLLVQATGIKAAEYRQSLLKDRKLPEDKEYENLSKAQIFLILSDESGSDTFEESDRDREFIADIRRRFFKEHESEIKAQINALEILEDTENKNSLALSETYCSLTENADSKLSMLQSLLAQFDKTSVKEGIRQMQTVLTHDLNCASRSHEISVLNSVAGMLSQSVSVHSALTMSEKFLDRMQHTHKINSEGITAADLLLRTLKTSESKIIDDSDVRDIYKEIRGKDPVQEAVIAHDFLSFVRESPSELYKEGEDRVRLLEAASELTDSVTAKEDEWLEGGN